MLDEALRLDGPAAVRFPKGTARQVPPDHVGSGLAARRVRQGADVCFLAVGKMVAAAEDAAELLAPHGVSATVWDVRLVKPLDVEMLRDAARHRLVVTAEDGVREGGVGSVMADAIASLDESYDGPPVVVLGTPVTFLPHGKPDQILANLGLDGPGLAAAATKALDAARPARAVAPDVDRG